MYHLIISFVFYVSFFLFIDRNPNIGYASLIMAFLSFVIYSYTKQIERKKVLKSMADAIENKNIQDLEVFEGIVTDAIDKGYSPFLPEYKILFIETDNQRQKKVYCKKYEMIEHAYKSKRKMKFYHEKSIVVWIEPAEKE